jgi:hypothetical protein
MLLLGGIEPFAVGYTIHVFSILAASTQWRIRMLVFDCFDIKAFRPSILPVWCHFRI